MNRKMLGTKCIVKKGVITGQKFYTYNNKKLHISGYGETKEKAWEMFQIIFNLVFNEKSKRYKAK